ncbi:MAG: chorismate mutase, partial [Bacteroidales bacterium]|nr:chorismate mutase [Bacteroidales bacterium]
ITPAMLRDILKVLVVRERQECSESLSELRREIDQMDERLLDILSKRMAISREIGRYKKENNIPVLQPLRYDRLVTQRVSQAAELMVDEEFIKLILEAIHEESVRQQIKIFNN